MNLTLGELIKELESLSTVVGEHADTNVSSVGSQTEAVHEWADNHYAGYGNKPKRRIARSVWVEQVITECAQTPSLPEFTNLVNE